MHWSALPTLACLWLLIDPTITGEQNQAVTKMFLWGTVTSLFYAGTLLLLFHGHGWLPRSLSRPVFRRVATLGYGVYLVHVPVMSRILLPLTQHLHVHRLPTVLVWPLLVVALLVLSLLVAYVMHIVIEKPSLAGCVTASPRSARAAVGRTSVPLPARRAPPRSAFPGSPLPPPNREDRTPEID